MNPQWTGAVKAKMHVNGITCKAVAQYMDVTPQYVSYLLHGQRSGKKAKVNLILAVEALARKKRGENNA